MCIRRINEYTKTHPMRTVILWCTAISMLAMAACSDSRYREKSEIADVSLHNNTVADSTAIEADVKAVAPLISPERKMIRTATLRVRVTDTQAAATKLENLVTSFSGIVVESNLQNDVLQTNEYPYQSDSLKKVQVYIPTAHMVLKVPVQHMDSVIHSIGNAAAFTNYRVLKQEDVTLKYLSNSMKIDAADKSLAQKVSTSGRRSVEAAEYTDAVKDQSIDRTVENLLMKENVAYATLEVEFFQGQQADVQVVINPNVVTRAWFGAELLTALRQGTDLLRGFLLVMVECWPLWVLIGVIWMVWRKRVRVPKMVMKH